MLDSKDSKKKKVSKKTKRSWRKNVDIKDVDRFLDDQRLQERLGKSASLKANDELFVVDTQGKAENPKSKISKQQLSKKEKRELLRNSEPKCFAILKPLSAVPDPISKRNFVKKPPISKKKKGGSIVKKSKSDGKAVNDVWTADMDKKISAVVNNEWFSNDLKRHTLAITEKRKKKLPTSLRKKTSVVSPIAAPHPGTSYNPSFEDHQELLQEVAADEMKLIKEERHLNRVTDKMFRRVTQEKKDEETMRELCEGMNTRTKDESGEETDDSTSLRAINPPTERKKKTLQQRRKQRESLKMQQEKIKDKIEKKKHSDMYKLKQMNSSIMKKQKIEALAKQKREEKEKQKLFEPKTLSRHKFEPIEQEFQTKQELSGNLRGLNPTGKLLKDRYKSLQQRNIIAPGTVHLKLNKPKVKKFIKPDHKIDFSVANK